MVKYCEEKDIPKASGKPPEIQDRISENNNKKNHQIVVKEVRKKAFKIIKTIEGISYESQEAD